MRPKSELKSGVILSYVLMLLQSAVSLLYTPIMLDLLGQAEYGLYQLAFSVISYLNILNFGLNSTYIRYYSKYNKNGDIAGIAKLNGLFMTVYGIISAAVLVIGGALAALSPLLFGSKLTAAELSKAPILMAIMTFNLATTLGVSVFGSIVIVNERFIFHRTLSIIFVLISPFIEVGLILLGLGSVSVCIATTINHGLQYIIIIIYCFKKLHIKFDFKNLDLKLLKEVGVFSFFIFITLIVDNINWSIDKFILGRMLGTTAVAVYSIGALFNSYYLSFSNVVGNVFSPRVNKLVSAGVDDSKLSELFIKVGRLQFLLLALIMTGYIFFGNQFILNIWAGEGYENSYMVGLLLMLPVTIPLIQCIATEVHRAKNMHRFPAYVNLGMAVFNLVISIFLCKFFGVIGCAIGTAVGMILGNGIVLNIYYKKKIGLDVGAFWLSILKMLPGLIVPCIFGVFLMQLPYVSMIRFLLYAAAYVVVYCISVWFLSMNDYEKGLVKKTLRKIFSILSRKKAVAGAIEAPTDDDKTQQE